MRARTAAYASHASHDGRERTRAASTNTPTQRPYWLRKVRQECPGLDDAEAVRRAELRHRQYMTGLALKSSRTRAARKAARPLDRA